MEIPIYDVQGLPPQDYVDYATLLRVYQTVHRPAHTPIVIDNGSYSCKAVRLRQGWAGEAEPRLAFRNLVLRQKGLHTDTLVGPEVPESELYK